MESDQLQLSSLLRAAKALSEARLDRILVIYKDNKYTVFLDQRTVIQIDNGSIVAYQLFNRFAARIAKDVLNLLQIDARVVYPNIMIGDQIV